MVRVGTKRFEELVAAALDSIPSELGEAMENVAVVVVPEPPTDEPDLLGLYTGTPLTDRGNYAGAMPDLIEIYAGPICRMCVNEDAVVREVRVTVIHEVAHHFGIDDDELHQLGWG